MCEVKKQAYLERIRYNSKHLFDVKTNITWRIVVALPLILNSLHFYNKAFKSSNWLLSVIRLSIA